MEMFRACSLYLRRRIPAPRTYFKSYLFLIGFAVASTLFIVKRRTDKIPDNVFGKLLDFKNGTIVAKSYFDAHDHLQHNAQHIVWESEPFVHQMKISENHVPVVIVDQHQAVIPYWFQAVGEGFLGRQKNTLIHIDAHSDMAPPDEADGVTELDLASPNLKRKSFLPLMIYNDAFILSAILKGVIRHVVWIRPAWLTDHYDTMKQKLVLGVTMDEFTKQRTACLCEVNDKILNCSYSKNRRVDVYPGDGNDSLSEDQMITIKPSECKMVSQFSVVMVSESKFKRVLRFKHLDNVLVDIDEDYFGVASGVRSFMDAGVTLHTQVKLNAFLYVLFCPQSMKAEATLNSRLKEMFGNALDLLMSNNSDRRAMAGISKTTSLLVKTYGCHSMAEENEILKQFLSFVSKINFEELEALKHIHYCLSNSPSLEITEEGGFGICHGTIYPHHTLNQIHIGSDREVAERCARLAHILRHIYSFSQPRLYTIARSLRDGYSPRHQQPFIERHLLQTLSHVLGEQGKEMNLMYDRELLFGSEGWP